MPNLMDFISGKYDSDVLRSQNEAQGAGLLNQNMQQQMAQQKIQTQQMQRMNDPQMWAQLASGLDNVISVTDDPATRAKLMQLRQAAAQGILPPDQMFQIMKGLDENKALLEEAKAAQAYAGAGYTNMSTQLVGRLPGMSGSAGAPPGGGMPGMPAMGATPGMTAPPMGVGGAPGRGGMSVTTATAPDGTRHSVLVDGSGNIVRDLGASP